MNLEYIGIAAFVWILKIGHML